MAIADLIQSQVQRALTILGRTWSYRTLTSSSNGVTQPTFSGWTPVAAVFTAQATTIQHEENSGRLVSHQMASLRITDAIKLKEGDQVQGPDGATWAIDAIASRGEGSIRYQIRLDKSYREEAGRGGGR